MSGIVQRARRALQWPLHRLEYEALVRVHPLRYLFFEVTRRCNLACVYCGSSCAPRSKQPELSTAEWIGVARTVAEDFEPTGVMVVITGGEPLLREDLLDLLSELRRLKFPFGMVTNGQFLDGERARRLVATGIGAISVSLDAPEDLNDRLRGQGVTRRVSEAIGHLRAAGFAGKLEVMSTITAPAVARLEETRRLVQALGVPLWRVVPVMPLGRAAERPELVPGPEDLRQLLEFVLAARRDGRAPTPEFCEEGYLGDRYEGEVRPFLNECLAGITVAGILSDGRIGACPELSDAFVQGDIHRERFGDVWRTRYQALRERSWTRKGACSSCADFGRCHGGSLHLYSKPGADMLRCFHLMLGEGRSQRPA
ncbi:MAG: radical SAM protein [Myxococcaceae bacterium]